MRWKRHFNLTFVLPVAGKPGAFIWMADRVNAKSQTEIDDFRQATHIWLPIILDPAQKSLRVAWRDQWDLGVFKDGFRVETDRPGTLRFWGGAAADLFTREIAESYAGVLRKRTRGGAMSLSHIDLCICWGFPDATPQDGLPRLRECGFDGIELWPDALDRFGADRWADALAAGGLRCFQLCPYFDFVHGPARIEASWRMLERFRQAARMLRCSRLRVFTGPPWGEGVVGAKDATAEQWAEATRCLREFCDAAPEVEFCLECHEGSLMEDSASALALIRGVARPNLTANLQLPLRAEPWEASVAALAEFTTHIHLHNWTQGLGKGSLTFLGEGAFDWRLVLRRLKRPVCLSVEHASHGDLHDPWETARRDGPYLQALRREATTERTG